MRERTGGDNPPPFVFSASVRASSLFGVCVRPARTFRPFLIQIKKYILAPGSQAARQEPDVCILRFVCFSSVRLRRRTAEKGELRCHVAPLIIVRACACARDNNDTLSDVLPGNHRERINLQEDDDHVFRHAISLRTRAGETRGWHHSRCETGGVSYSIVEKKQHEEERMAALASSRPPPKPTPSGGWGVHCRASQHHPSRRQR